MIFARGADQIHLILRLTVNQQFRIDVACIHEMLLGEQFPLV